MENTGQGVDVLQSLHLHTTQEKGAELIHAPSGIRKRHVILERSVLVALNGEVTAKTYRTSNYIK